ncbi:hypothetical protein C8R41DRAFT_863576 [Lentinula lateritia]|uniref:Uncharacterized protein n=1 Tax=Lentinula lateritia TaxID=40482 RepID=A0ABQ8VV90_9AGAR|nr:hypothetical protein C8R41DRAFT_863576 [Lentinula lateritia]
MGDPLSENNTSLFFANLSVVTGSLCPGVGPDTPSYSGYIGSKHDTNSSPRRSFFWHFGAESHDPNAPIMCVRELISRSLYSGRLNLVQESLMIHNPFTEDLSTSSQSQDPYSHFRGSLQCHCVDHNVYNETTCKEAYSTLPECPEALDYALESENSTPKHRFAAIELCAKCRPDDVDSCYPEFKWVRELFNERKTKTMLGVPEYVNHTSLNMDVGKAFSEYGDKDLSPNFPSRAASSPVRVFTSRWHQTTSEPKTPIVLGQGSFRF